MVYKYYFLIGLLCLQSELRQLNGAAVVTKSESLFGDSLFMSTKPTKANTKMPVSLLYPISEEPENVPVTSTTMPPIQLDAIPATKKSSKKNQFMPGNLATETTVEPTEPATSVVPTFSIQLTNEIDQTTSAAVKITKKMKKTKATESTTLPFETTSPTVAPTTNIESQFETTSREEISTAYETTPGGSEAISTTAETSTAFDTTSEGREETSTAVETSTVFETTSETVEADSSTFEPPTKTKKKKKTKTIETTSEFIEATTQLIETTSTSMDATSEFGSTFKTSETSTTFETTSVAALSTTPETSTVFETTFEHDELASTTVFETTSQASDAPSTTSFAPTTETIDLPTTIPIITTTSALPVMPNISPLSVSYDNATGKLQWRTIDDIQAPNLIYAVYYGRTNEMPQPIALTTGTSFKLPELPPCTNYTALVRIQNGTAAIDVYHNFSTPVTKTQSPRDVQFHFEDAGRALNISWKQSYFCERLTSAADHPLQYVINVTNTETNRTATKIVNATDNQWMVFKWPNITIAGGSYIVGVVSDEPNANAAYIRVMAPPPASLYAPSTGSIGYGWFVAFGLSILVVAAACVAFRWRQSNRGGNGSEYASLIDPDDA